MNHLITFKTQVSKLAPAELREILEDTCGEFKVLQVKGSQVIVQAESVIVTDEIKSVEGTNRVAL